MHYPRSAFLSCVSAEFDAEGTEVERVCVEVGNMKRTHVYVSNQICNMKEREVRLSSLFEVPYSPERGSKRKRCDASRLLVSRDIECNHRGH